MKFKPSTCNSKVKKQYQVICSLERTRTKEKTAKDFSMEEEVTVKNLMNIRKQLRE